MRTDFLEWMGKLDEGYTVTQLSPEDIAKQQDAVEYGEREGLEPSGRRGFEHIFYDSKEGKYYDRRKDMYLDNEEATALGLMG